MSFLSDYVNRINTSVRNAVYSWLFTGSTPPNADQVEKGIQDLVAVARLYYDGNHTVYLTERQKAWLYLHGTTVRFTVNHCPVVVDSVVERLKVTGFGTPGNDASTTLWDWWKQNRMDAVQTETHRAAVRDGSAYQIVDWDEETQMPVYTFHNRFVETANGGDDYGVRVEYPSNDLLAKPIRAIKQWEEEYFEGDKRKNRTRRTLYYPDRIEKEVYERGDWKQYQPEGEPWPLPWLDTDGKPLGIPVVHFHTPGAKSDLRDVIPLQDALNKSWLDILGAADMTGFQMLAFFGWIPTTDGKEPADDGSNLLQVAPGQLFGTMATDASVEVIQPASMQPLLDVEDRIVVRIASVTGTPLARFLSSRQIASAETQRQQEAPLIAKVVDRQTLFGNAWEDLMKMSIKLARRFGNQTLDASEINTVWQNAETKDEAIALDIAERKKKLGIPLEVALSEYGYSEEEIADMKKAPEWEARTANLNMARMTAEGYDAK